MAIFRAFYGMIKHAFVAAVLCLSFGTMSAYASLCVSYSCGSGGGSAPSTDCGNSGDLKTIKFNTCTPPSGLGFDIWNCYDDYYNSTSSKNPNEQVYMNGNVSCTAQWSANTANCSVVYNYGNCSKSYPYGGGGYGNIGGSIVVLPTLNQVCTDDSNCNNLATSCGIPAGATFNGWNCGNYLQGGSCNVSGNIYPAGTQMCKIANQCSVQCTADITTPPAATYSVTYSCGSGASGSVSGGTATYGSGFTFASASNCSNPGKKFAEWSCTNSVGTHNANENITWNYSTGTLCTAQWDDALDCKSPQVQIPLSLDSGLTISETGYFSADETDKTANSDEYKLEAGMWGATFDGSNDIITGNAKCDTFVGGVPGDYTSVLDDVPGVYCWCNATQYTPKATEQPQDMFTNWVYVDKFNNNAICEASCAATCADSMDDSNFRSALFSEGVICQEVDCVINYDAGKDPNCATGSASVPVTDTPYITPYPNQINGINIVNACQFEGWLNEDNNAVYYPDGEEVNIDECKEEGSITLTAQWGQQIQSYPVTYNCGSGGTGTVPSGTAGENQSFTFEGSSYCTNSGMVLDHWSCTNSVGDHAPGSSVTWNYATGTTCTAIWNKPVIYSMIYNCGLGSGTAPVDSNSPYSTGSNTTVTVKQNTCTAASNATFNGWSCNGVTRNPNSTFTITENTTCTALWQCGTGYTMGSTVLDGLYPGEEDNDPPVNLDANDNMYYYGVRFSYGDVYVSGMCSNDGYGYQQLDSGNPTRVSNDTSGNYCWCKATKYRPGGSNTIYNLNTTSWILLDSGTNICNVGSAGNDSCLSMCGRAFAGNSGNLVVDIDDFRDALYAGQACVPGGFTINLSSQNATDHGSTQIYTTYNTGVYLDNDRMYKMEVPQSNLSFYTIITPERTNYKFLGYYSTSQNNTNGICTGTQYIDEYGAITADGITAGIGYTNTATWYACWTNVVTLRWDPGCEAANDCTAFTTTCTYGGTFTTPSAPAVDPTLSGIYTFGGWSESATSNTNYYNTNTTHNCTSADLFGAGSGDTVDFYGFWNCGVGYHRPSTTLENYTNEHWETIHNGNNGGYWTNHWQSDRVPNGTALGSLIGESSCSTTVPNRSYDTRSNISTHSGQYCWCKIKGYYEPALNLPNNVSSADIPDSDPDYNYYYWVYSQWEPSVACANSTSCSIACSNVVSGTIDEREQILLSGRNLCIPNMFNVQYAGNGNTGGNAPSAPTSCTYNSGDCDAPANTYTKSGWTFTGWACTSSSGSCASATYDPDDDISTATSVNGATITLTAQWEQDVYIISLDDVDGSGGDGEVKEIYGVKWLDVHDDDIDQVSIPELEDTVFAGYFTDQDPSTGIRKIGPDGSLPSNTTFSSDTTLYAHFEKCSCTPGAHVADCDVGDPVVRDNRCNFKYSCDDGYDFQQNEDGTFTGAVGVGENTSPACVAVCNTITLNRNGGTGGTSYLYKLTDNARWFSDNQCSDRVTKIPSAPTKNGYTYNGHYNSANGSTNYIASDGTLDASWTVNQNTTIYAQWSANTLNFEWDPKGGTPAEIDTPATCTYGANAGDTGGLNDIAQPTKTGYDFAGWILTNWSAETNGG